MKLKVMTVVGTRPEIIRLAETIKACDRYFNHVLVHTGQNYDYTLNQIFFENLELREPDYYLDAVGDHLGETVGNIIAKSYAVIQEEKPDALLVLGDTNSCLVAYSAKRCKVPIFHMEAGNRCFDMNVPEEINRRLVDHLSDINLPYTENSRKYLISEGIAEDRVYVTGSPMHEVLLKNKTQIENSNILKDLSLEKDQYIVVSAHREENIDNEDHFFSLMNALNDIAVQLDMRIVYSVHPRTEKFLKQRNFEFDRRVTQVKPLGFHDYVQLQKNSYCVLSDSGTLSEESAMLGFPAVLLRTSTERPEALDAGSILVGGIHYKSIMQALQMSREMIANQEPLVLPDDYKDTNVSLKVVKIIQSYTSIINKRTWGKDE